MKKIIVVFIMYCNIVFAQNNERETTVHFWSKSLQEEKAFDIILPIDYYSDKLLRFPVFYFLHGAGGDNTSYGFFDIIVDSLTNKNTIDNMIIVKPDGSCKPFLGSVYTNSELYGNYEDYIVYDVVNYIDRNYRTFPFKYCRTIAGHSMGAYGALKLAFKHPDIFCAGISLSGNPDLLQLKHWIPDIIEEAGKKPYRFEYNTSKFFTAVFYTLAGAFSPNLNNKPYPVDFPIDEYGEINVSVVQRWKPHNLPFLASKLDRNQELSIYFDCGLNDELAMNEFNISFADSLRKLNIPFTYLTYNGNHTNKIPQRIKIAMCYADSVYNSYSDIIDYQNCELKNLVSCEMVNLSESNEVIFRYFSDSTGSMSYSLFDAMGNQIIENNQTSVLNNGFNLLKISKNSLSLGSYTLFIQKNNETIYFNFCIY